MALQVTVCIWQKNGKPIEDKYFIGLKCKDIGYISNENEEPEVTSATDEFCFSGCPVRS